MSRDPTDMLLRRLTTMGKDLEKLKRHEHATGRNTPSPSGALAYGVAYDMTASASGVSGYYEITMSSTSGTLDLENLSPGVYVVTGHFESNALAAGNVVAAAASFSNVPANVFGYVGNQAEQVDTSGNQAVYVSFSDVVVVDVATHLRMAVARWTGGVNQTTVSGKASIAAVQLA